MEIPFGSLAAAVVFAGAYLAGGGLGASEAGERFWSRRRFLSAAAGISVAYIFIDVLPELEFQRQVVVKAAGGTELLFAEQRIYLLALLSFVVLYGLEHMVLVNRERRRESVAAGDADAVFWLQLAGYAAYSALIGYLVIERAERGVLPLIAYTFAMAVHFLIVDHSLERGAWTCVSAAWTLAAGGQRSRRMAGRRGGAAFRSGGGAAVRGPRRRGCHHQPARRAARRPGRAVLAVLSRRRDLRGRSDRGLMLYRENVMRGHALLVVLTLLAVSNAGHCQTPGGAEPAKPRQLTIANKPWTGDFDKMLERRMIRVYSPFSRSLYFNDKGRERGIAVELVRDWERYLNVKYAKQLGKRPLTIYIAPATRDKLLPSLNEGLADVAIGNLTVTEERLKEVDFIPGDEGRKIISEVVVSGPKSPDLKLTLDAQAEAAKARGQVAPAKS